MRSIRSSSQLCSISPLSGQRAMAQRRRAQSMAARQRTRIRSLCAGQHEAGVYVGFHPAWGPIHYLCRSGPDLEYMVHYGCHTVALQHALSLALSADGLAGRHIRGGRLSAVRHQNAEKIVRNTFVASLITSIIWALGHTLYPIYPVISRPIELVIIGLLFSYIF